MLVVRNCPFCGEEGIIFSCEDAMYAGKKGVTNYGVGCLTSGCYGEQNNDLAYFSTAEKAAITWNTRA